MFEGKKYILLSTANALGGENHSTFLAFMLFSALLFFASIILMFVSKRNA